MHRKSSGFVSGLLLPAEDEDFNIRRPEEEGSHDRFHVLSRSSPRARWEAQTMAGATHLVLDHEKIR